MLPWSQCVKILCIRLDNLGDLVMTTPAIRALKESHPQRRLTALVSSTTAPIVPLIAELEDAIVYDAPWVKHSESGAHGVKDFQMIEILRSRQFDAAVIFTVFSQNPLPAAMLCYLAGIPLRLAYCHENPYELLTDWIKDPDPHSGIRHEVVRQLDLVASVGSRTAHSRLSLETPWDAKESVIDRLREHRLRLTEPFIVIHPGSTAPSRRYSAEKFAQVARALRRQLQCPIIFTGSADERDLIEKIQRDAHIDSASFIGSLDIGELTALIAMAAVLVSNNTAPAHIAAATGTPVVDLYALTNPQHTPWQVPSRVLFHDVPCKYCFKSICPQGHHQCLDLVSVEDVVEAVHELLGEEQGLIVNPN